ncbi:MAG TPA: hypothetical protein VF335_09100, partial [Chitinivibrionales bacterium]
MAKRSPVTLRSQAVAVFFGIVCIMAARSWSQEEQAVNPTTSGNASRGMTQISSAEPLGAGRLTLSLQGAWYQQQRPFFGAPDSGANILTALGAMSFGINSYIDIFGSIAGFGSTNYTNSTNDKAGVGTVMGGFQGSLPLPAASPFRLGMQCVIFAGTSTNQINTNKADGYNYFETRTYYDFMGKLLQSFVFGNELRGLKLHLNESFVFSVEHQKGDLLLLGGGAQWFVYSLLVLGIECNSRTFLSNTEFKTDPLWITPSFTLRTPYYFNFYAGGDIALSQDRTGVEPRALEPYRLFSGLA